MAWIESHQQLEKHPKVFDLMYSMGWDLDQTIGKLHRFWWWCVDYAEDGDLRKHNNERLARAVGLNSELATHFVESMVQSSWIDRTPYFRVHDWWRYVGRFLNGKYSGEPERWKQVRDVYSNPTVTRRLPSVPNLTIPNQTKPKPPPYSPPKGDGDFDFFWKEYPRKIGKKAALKAWLKLSPGEELRARILEAVKRQKSWPQWNRDNGQFIPLPTTWLTQGRWDDEYVDRRCPKCNDRGTFVSSTGYQISCECPAAKMAK